MQEFNLDNSKLQMETEESSASFFDFEKIKMVFLLHWKWFIPSVVICLLIAMYYLWVTPTTISVTGKMQLIDKNQGKSSSSNAGLAILSSLPLGLGNSISSSLGGAAGIDIEKEILTSTDLAREVVLDMNLYTGCEIYYTDDAARLLNEGKIPTIAGTRYVLVEFSPADPMDRLREAAYSLGRAGYRPIYAHVERYSCLSDLNNLEELHDDLDIILQVNCSTAMDHGFFSGRWFRRAMASAKHGFSVRRSP